MRSSATPQRQATQTSATTRTTRAVAAPIASRCSLSRSIQGQISVGIDPSPGLHPFILCIRRPRRARYVRDRFTFRLARGRSPVRAQCCCRRDRDFAHGLQLGAAGRHSGRVVPPAARDGHADGEPAPGLRAGAPRARAADPARARNDPVHRRRGAHRPDDGAVPLAHRSRGHEGARAELPVRPREPGEAALALHRPRRQRRAAERRRDQGHRRDAGLVERRARDPRARAARSMRCANGATSASASCPAA